MPDIIRAADLRPEPWKNGGGITREIRSMRTDRGIGWRLSMADVETDGPFSLFADMHRILTVIDGEGLVLEGPDQRLVARCCEPVSFPGDVALDCQLTRGPVRDFNVIFRPDLFDISVSVLASEMEVDLDVQANETVVIFVADGACDVAGARLDRADTFWATSGPINAAVQVGGTALIVRIFQIQV